MRSRQADLSGLQTDEARQLAQIAQANTAALRAQQQARQQLETQLVQIDRQRYQELRHAHETTNRLSADLAAARQRLRIRIDPASCPDRMPAISGVAGVNNDAAGARAELHAETAAGVVRVAGEADQCRAKLAGLQEWARRYRGRGIEISRTGEDGLFL
ncbi:lysis system i-spanin subunit Rz [Azotobacter armeniacus]